MPEFLRYARTHACLIAVLTSAPAIVTADPLDDRLLASQCAQCHGTDGAARGDMESLAGKEFTDLFDAMIDMKDETPPDEIMHFQARGYSDEAIRRIAEYFAALPVPEDDHDD